MKVSILGCGWLGVPLAKALLATKAKVKGSVRTTPAAENLQKMGVEPIRLSLGQNGIEGEQWESFFDTEYLVCLIPFKRNAPSSHYENQIQLMVEQCRRFKPKQVVFASSTTVYPERPFSETAEWVESDIIENPTERGAALLRCEELVLGLGHVAVLRIGGMLGADRQATRTLSKSEPISNPDATMNLIHQDDCVSIIEQLLVEGQTGVYNLVSDVHPTRRVFYTSQAVKLGFPKPQFLTQTHSHKCILNQNVRNKLNYVFRYPNPVAFP